MRMLRLCIGMTLGVVLVGPTVASGQNIFDDTSSTCITANCSSLRIPGTVFAFGPSAGQFVISVFATPGQCVRLDLISPPHPAPDMELVVIAPNGTVYRNDDRNGALDRRPLVKIGSAPNNGWYTVRVGQFAGVATETNVVLMYGRYNAGNPNCATPTGPLSTVNAFGFGVEAAEEDAEKDATRDAQRPVPAPEAGQPGARQE
jgi:hypothetical protein